MDQFTTAITMLKWKMNARAFKLKEMVNLSILKSDDQTLPRSKKGIQLAYQRVISNRKFNI